MKSLPVDNFGFVEVGGVGEMIYKAVRFPSYSPDMCDEGEILVPAFFLTVPPTSGTDYSLTGQELLASLCNLYKQLNAPDSDIPISTAIWYWCRTNIHPYNIATLAGDIESDKEAYIYMADIIKSDGTIYIEDFKKDLCDLGTVFEYYFALKRLKDTSNVSLVRALYYEGRIRDSLSAFEYYRNIDDDAEYKAKVMAEYKEHISRVIGMMPDFHMRLKVDNKNGTVKFGADINSVFDICWYRFARMVADVTPPADKSMDYMESTGSVLSCLCCGNYFVRHSGRQLYCDNSDCQAERNNRKSRAYYARKKAEQIEPVGKSE